MKRYKLIKDYFVTILLIFKNQRHGLNLLCISCYMKSKHIYVANPVEVKNGRESSGGAFTGPLREGTFILSKIRHIK